MDKTFLPIQAYTSFKFVAIFDPNLEVLNKILFDILTIFFKDGFYLVDFCSVDYQFFEGVDQISSISFVELIDEL